LKLTETEKREFIEKGELNGNIDLNENYPSREGFNYSLHISGIQGQNK